MKRIFKYPVQVTDGTPEVITFPKGCTVLRDAIPQPTGIMLYALVDDTETETGSAEVGVVGTGWPLPDHPIYDPKYHFGTVDDRGLVWHIFIRPV